MKESKYFKTLAYGVLPLMALLFFVNILETAIDGYSLGYSELINIIEIVLYTLTSVSIIRGSRNAGYFFKAAVGITMLRILVSGIYHIATAESAKDIASESFSVVFPVVVLIIWLIYSLKQFKKVEKIEENQAISEELKLSETVDEKTEFSLAWEISSEDTPAVKTEKNSNKRIILKSIILSLVMILISGIVFSIIDQIYNCLYYLFVYEKINNLLRAQRVEQLCYAISRFTEVGFGVWVAFLFSKTGIVSYEFQSLKKGKKSALCFLYGMLLSLFLMGCFAFVLKIQGCGFSVNSINTRVLITMGCSVLTYLGVAVGEEVVSRGIILGYCEENGKRIWGIFLSTFIFTILHFLTGAYDKPASFVFLFAVGLLLAALKIYSDNLWLAIGYHFMYDWAVTHFLELRVLNNKASIFSVLKMTLWKSSLSITIPSVLCALAIFALLKKKAEDTKCNL